MDENENGRAKPVRLSRPQQRDLEDWLVAEWPSIEDRRPTQAEVVKKYNQLGRHLLERVPSNAPQTHYQEITEGNLRGAVVAIGKRWPTSQAAQAAKQTAGLRHQVAVLAFEFRRFIGHFDEALRDLWSGGAYELSDRFCTTFPMVGAVAANGGAAPVADEGEAAVPAGPAAAEGESILAPDIGGVRGPGDMDPAKLPY